MDQNNSVETGNFMEIIRQRLFINHDSKSQRKVTVEYTIRSKIKELKNIFLNYDKFLPSLKIHDETNTIVPLMPSRDVEILYGNMIDKADGDMRLQLEKELEDLQNNKKHLIWISLRDKPILQDEIRTFTLTYIPVNQKLKNQKILIKIKKQNYPVYYSLFSPNSFNFKKPNFLIYKSGKIICRKESPDHVYVYDGHQSMSLRVTNKITDDFALVYSLAIMPTSTLLTIMGSAILSCLPIIHIVIAYMDISGFELFFQKKIEIILFVVGGSLILPVIQSNQNVRDRLLLWYLLPASLGLIMIFC